MADNEIKLKPCPFCGGRAYVTYSNVAQRCYIDCEHTDGCGSRPNTFFVPNEYNLYIHMLKWNNRHETKKPVKILGKKTNLWKE